VVRERTFGAVAASTVNGQLEVESRLLAQGRRMTLIHIFGYKMGFGIKTVMTTNHLFWASVGLFRGAEQGSITSESPEPDAAQIEGATDIRPSFVIDLFRVGIHVMTDSGVGNPLFWESPWAYTDLLVPEVQLRAAVAPSVITLEWDAFAVMDWERVAVSTKVYLSAMAAAGIDAKDRDESHLVAS